MKLLPLKQQLLDLNRCCSKLLFDQYKLLRWTRSSGSGRDLKIDQRYLVIDIDLSVA